ncbi:MAG: metallophosphoesterase [Chlorobi bacterium]|nr:metallophosphoesterase [Chlorobiota bacterium]
MRNYFLQIGSAVLVVGSWGLAVFLLWALHRQWWWVRWVRRLSWQVPLAGLLFVGLWLLGDWLSLAGLALAAAIGTIAVITTGLALLLSLPFSGVLLSAERLVKWMLAKWSQKSNLRDKPQPSLPSVASAVAETLGAETLQSPLRRSLLAKGAVVIPGTLLAANAWGLASAWGAVQIPTIPLHYPNLPPQLRGLRILHLSDIHLGSFIFMKDLEECMIAAEHARPDLVLVSGDVADELHQLPDALRMIAELKPRYGTFASLGNHEYYRGIETVQKAFDRGPIPLLREEGATVKVGGSQLFIAGADDPARSGSEKNRPQFLQRTVDASLDGAPSDAFHILMSHRPEGWDRAAEEGIELTVAGHYHGGIQIGFGGHGVIEPLTPNNYIWGHYQRGNSQLYTSAGVGHWLPFRLGCPRQAPLYVIS